MRYTDEMYEADYGLVMRLRQPTVKVESKTAWSAYAVGFSILMAGIILLAVSCQSANAEVYDSEQIVEAIYKVEGGAKAKKPFGILSVSCEGYEDCRKVCLRTVENSFSRWQMAGQSEPFLEYLSKRYAPIGAENDNGTNKYWLKNLKHFLAKGGSR